VAAHLDGIELALQLMVVPHGVRIRVQTLSPEPIVDDCYGAALVALRVRSPGRRADSQNLEKIRAGGHLPRHLFVRRCCPCDIPEAGVEGEILEDAGVAEFANIGCS
jgi:hypothetical protein